MIKVEVELREHRDRDNVAIIEREYMEIFVKLAVQVIIEQ